MPKSDRVEGLIPSQSRQLRGWLDALLLVGRVMMRVTLHFARSLCKKWVEMGLFLSESLIQVREGGKWVCLSVLLFSSGLFFLCCSIARTFRAASMCNNLALDRLREFLKRSVG